MTAIRIALSVTVYGDGDHGVPVLLVAGIPGHQEEVGFLIDAGVVRVLRPTRGIPARLPERPMAPGLPSLAHMLRSAAMAEMEVSDA